MTFKDQEISQEIAIFKNLKSIMNEKLLPISLALERKYQISFIQLHFQFFSNQFKCN